MSLKTESVKWTYNQYRIFGLAMEQAINDHFEQTRDDGSPYCFHPIAVMTKVKSPEAKIVALLHDILEDCYKTDESRDREVSRMTHTYGSYITKIVLILTRRDGEDYQTYIERVKKDPLATEVKIADLHHNLETLHVDEWTSKDERFRKFCKYQNALQYLQGLKDQY